MTFGPILISSLYALLLWAVFNRAGVRQACETDRATLQSDQADGFPPPWMANNDLVTHSVVPHVPVPLEMETYSMHLRLNDIASVSNHRLIGSH